MSVPISSAIADAVQRLAAAGVESPEVDAWRLMRFAVEPQGLSSGPAPSDVLDVDTLASFETYVRQRQLRRPVAQITGRRWFYSSEFLINSAVLDPRPESEILVTATIERRPRRLLDLGTGSGCLLLSVLQHCLETTGIGTDISEAAIRVARNNAKRLRLGDRAEFQRASWCTGIKGQFDVILSNPPYVSADEYRRLQPEIRDFEPREALTTGGDGTAAYQEIADAVRPVLSQNGSVIVEVGAGQSGRVEKIFEASGFTIEQLLNDFDGRTRAIVFGAGRKPS